MNISHFFSPPTLGLLVYLVGTTPIFAAEKPSGSSSTLTHEVRVILFGQPCLLSGAYPKKVLEKIHSISPEKMPPAMDLKSTLESLKKLQDSQKGSKEIPDHLADYAAMLKKYYTAMEVYFKALPSLLKDSSTDEFVKQIQSVVPKTSIPKLKTKAEQVLMEARLNKNKASLSESSSVEDLLDLFMESAPKREEILFHQAIRIMGVSYLCAFGESD